MGKNLQEIKGVPYENTAQPNLGNDSKDFK